MQFRLQKFSAASFLLLVLSGNIWLSTRCEQVAAKREPCFIAPSPLLHRLQPFATKPARPVTQFGRIPSTSSTPKHVAAMCTPQGSVQEETTSPRDVDVEGGASSDNLQPTPTGSRSSLEAVRFRWELFNRQATVFYIAARLFMSIKMTQWRCNQLGMDEEEQQEEIWNETHEKNAKFLVSKLISLQGLWVKLGQFLSSRADVMPEPYLRELRQCQDTLPARPFEEIKQQIEEELGAPLDHTFQHVEETPIACASIGQVHKATLRSGKAVVIKVRKKKVASRMLQDVANLETIGTIARSLDPDFDMRPLLREWSASIPRELDFAQEAANMQRVQANFQEWRGRHDLASDVKVNVEFAQVVPELVTEKVLVMSLIDGFKVDDQEELKENNVDAEDTVLQITRSLALQIFNHGFFNGDPHPGNLMVDRGSKNPVLLDFGIVKELDDERRLAFAKLLVAAAEQDINGLLEALNGIGLRLRPEVPFDAQLLVKYFFRDAKPREEAKEEAKERREEARKKQEKEKRTLNVGDKVDVRLPAMVPGLKTSRQGEVLELRDADQTATVRFTSGSTKTVPRSSVKVQKKRSPIDAWPDSFIFFDRVTGLLRGLAASMNVSVSYISVMTPYARAALMDSGAKDEADVSGVDRHGAVTARLRELIKSGAVLGAQVCVMRDGEAVVDVAAGRKSPYSAEAVAADSLFNSFSVTKGVAAAALHLLADRGHLDLSAPVSRYWPEFASRSGDPAAKERITVEHVLNHQAGLHRAGFEELAKDPYMGCDSEVMLRILEEASPSAPAGSETQYHALTFGWLLDGIVRGAVNRTLADVVAEDLAKPLGMQDEIKIGLGKGGAEDSSVQARLTQLVVQRQAAAETAKRVQQEAEREGGAEESSQDEEARTAFLNPTLFNSARLREASIPAANGHFSARGLARLYDALLADARGSEPSKLFSTRHWPETVGRHFGGLGSAEEVKDDLIQAGSGRFGMGFAVFAHKGGPACFGHAGVGGSVAFSDPRNNLSVAITLNRLGWDGTTTKALIHEIYSSLGAEPPESYRASVSAGGAAPSPAAAGAATQAEEIAVQQN